MPSTETKNLWFYSGLFMLLFSMLFIEPYYSSPKNVITNSIPLLLVLVSIKASFENIGFWWLAVSALAILIIISILAIVLIDNNKSPDCFINRISKKFKDVAVFFGQGKVLYSIAFLGFLLAYYSIGDFYTLILFIVWFFIMSINPKHLTNNFELANKKYANNAIGEIFGVQSKRMFLVKLFDDLENINKFDVINFNYSMVGSESILQGIVFDTYLLNNQKWAKVLVLRNLPSNADLPMVQNVAYRVSNPSAIFES